MGEPGLSMVVDVGATPFGAPSPLGERIAALRAAIDEAARAAGRDPASITLVGVTKTRPRETVLAAIEAGLNDVGETYAQEARTKFTGLPPVRKHFIGHIQTNKARAIVETFDVVQSIDRLEAGVAIARAQQALGKRIKTLLQLDISPTARFGLDPAEAPEIAKRLRDEEGLEIDGVMAIGPLSADRETVLRAFRLAARAAECIGGSTLSLGMTADWREAIVSGSTMVRIGTALFGPRPPRKQTQPDREPAGR